MTMNCKTHKLERHPVTVIELSGELDGDDAMKPVTEAAVKDGAENVALIMGNLTYLNSRGVSLLLTLNGKVQELGFKLYLVNPAGPIRKVVEQVGASSVLDIRESLDEILHT